MLGWLTANYFMKKAKISSTALKTLAVKKF